MRARKLVRTDRGCGRFTYVELIVVIAVIGLLTVMLFPVFTKSRSTSHRSTCEFNLLTVGMALKTYADDYKVYPVGDEVISILNAEGLIKASGDFRCPLDTSAEGNTYAVGYLGGHPRTIQLDDPLVVCGWHKRIGTLAVFPDTNVRILNQETSDDSQIIPITVTNGGQDVGPGFLLHQSNATVIKSADGNEALIYGDNGPYFISASYDPTAYSGTGMFTVVVGFDTSWNAPDQSVSGESNPTYVKIQTAFEYCKVNVTNNPAVNDETSLSWQPDTMLLTNQVSIEYFKIYKITHLYTGQFDEKEFVGQNAYSYNITPILLGPQ